MTRVVGFEVSPEGSFWGSRPRCLRRQFGNAAGEIGDQRLTVMAGIMVMDELSELQKRVKGMESEVLTLRKTRDEALTKADKSDNVLTTALDALAQRMEDLAMTLAIKKA